MDPAALDRLARSQAGGISGGQQNRGGQPTEAELRAMMERDLESALANFVQTHMLDITLNQWANGVVPGGPLANLAASMPRYAQWLSDSELNLIRLDYEMRIMDLHIQSQWQGIPHIAAGEHYPHLMMPEVDVMSALQLSMEQLTSPGPENLMTEHTWGPYI